MSNPSQEKAPVLKLEQAKEDPRGVQVSEQQARERCRDAVHEARIEPKQSAENTKNTEKNIDKPHVKIITGIERNFLNDDNNNQIEIYKVPYPDVQMSHDATGKLDHIDFKPNKDR